MATALFVAALLAHNAFAQTRQCAPTDGGCKCAASGWTWSPDPKICGFALDIMRDVEAGANHSGCTIDSSFTFFSECADIVGPNFDFPTKEARSVYYYNCDPDGTRGLIPATINTIAATACQCADFRKAVVGAQTAGIINDLPLTNYAAASCACAPPFADNEDGTDCVLNCEAPSFPNSDKTGCDCPSGYRKLGLSCIPDAENFGGDVSQQYLCRAFGGTLQMAGNGEVCSGIDRHDTFCIVDSSGAFPCRGLFKHLRECNLRYGRPAENMFFCGAKCASDKTAVGAECR